MEYRFNDYILDTEKFQLSHLGQPMHLEPQVIELLAFLIQHRERMVSKEEINGAVWGGRVVSDAALSSRIKTLRRALGDDGRNQSVIRTVHRKGFRFVAALQNPGEPGPTEVADTPPLPSRPAIAVLCFTNLSQQAGEEYFADGITADIINQLAKHRWLKVAARNTTFGFKGRAVDVREIGRQLGVNYVVEGSVQRAGDRVRITVHLVDATTGLQQWSERYDREVQDIFALQDEITETVVARLEPEIGFAERHRVVHARPANLQAWDCYHLGIYHFFQFTGEDNLQAQRLLSQSQRLDEHFGEAWAWWAYTVVLGMVYWDTRPTPRLLDEALSACRKALALDPHNALFYALQARVLLARGEYDHAIIDNRKAIELNPTLAAAHCGLGDSLAYEARYEEAGECFDKAIALSPNDPQLWAFHTYYALMLLFKGDYRKALAQLQRASAIPNCQYWTRAHSTVAYTLLGEHQQAAAMKEKLLREKPGFSLEFAREKLFYLKRQDQLQLYLDALQGAGIS